VTKRDRSLIFWKDENGNDVQVGQIQGRENWTDADWDEDARRNKVNTEVAALRKRALLVRGWELNHARCSRHAHGEWAKDPSTGEHVSHAEAYRLQEEREPGSVPSWPKFENGWSPPPSTQGLIKNEIIAIQPMKAPVGSIFYLDYQYGAQEKGRK
jgi:hypothetical protein